MTFNDILRSIYSQQIDFKFDRKTGQYYAKKLNADPTMVLYRDGIFRKTTDQELRQQLAKLLTKE